MSILKTTIAATTAALFATSAYAGSYDDNTIQKDRYDKTRYEQDARHYNKMSSAAGYGNDLPANPHVNMGIVTKQGTHLRAPVQSGNLAIASQVNRTFAGNHKY